MKKIQILIFILIGIVIGMVSDVVVTVAYGQDVDDSMLMLSDNIPDDFKAFASTCTLKVTPSKIYNRRVGRLGAIVVSGIDFDKGDIVDWGTDEIVTICDIRFPKRIFNIVWIRKDADPAVYDVTVGDDNCTGTIEIR